MTITISLPSETEARLRKQAADSGKDLSALVREAIEEMLAATNEAQTPNLQAAADFDETMDQFFRTNLEKLSSLPADFSRADIYANHA